MILNGEDPADIEIKTPRKINTYLNLKVAKELGIDIPREIIRSAEEVFKE